MHRAIRLGHLRRAQHWLKLAAGVSLAASMFVGCAREQSAEERRREEREREVERLHRAVGSYQGEVETANKRAIPFAMTVNVVRNPENGNEEPRLAAQMRLGLFGGVDLTTEKVSFDSGTGQLSASFASGAPKALSLGNDGSSAPQPGSEPGKGPVAGKTLELHAQVIEAGLTSARLIASSGKIFELQGGRAAGMSLDAPSLEQSYGIRIAHDEYGTAAEALLSLTRRTGSIAAPASSDMTQMPQLDASLRFPGAARVAHVANSVEYDALEDTLEVSFPGGGGLRLIFNNVSGSGDQALAFTSTPTLTGTVVTGAKTIGTVVASDDQSRVITKTRNSDLPAPNYIGHYQNSAGRKMAVVANISYLGEDGAVATSTPLNRFPKLRMQLSLCVGDRAFDTKKLDLVSLDYLKSEAVFVGTSDNNVRRIYATYGDAWSRLDTTRIDDRSDPDSGPNQASIHLEASTENERALTCADAPKLSVAEELESMLSPEVSTAMERRRDADDGGTIEDPFLTYEGYLTRGGGAAVPIGIAIFPRQNPGGGTDEPSLQVTARVGFFGGANLASEPAVFNWGSGRISASFQRPSGAPLELRGILEPDTLRDAVLIGPNLGQSVLTVHRESPPYASASQEAVFNTALAKGAGPVDPDNALQGILTLRSRAEGSTAPANIDLPVLPSIDASLRIDGLGQTPQVGTRVLYDVLRGTMEVSFSESSVLEFSNIFLVKTNDPNRPYAPFTALDGRLILGGQPVATAHADDVTNRTRWPVQDLPYTIYIGTYKGGGSSQRLKALARVDYPGNAGRNTAEYPFQSFPNLHMTVTLCLGSSAFSRRNLELEAVDYLERRLVFKNRDTNARNSLEVAFEPRWMTLKGEFRDTDGSSGDTQGSQLDLTALPNASNIDCATPLPSP